MAQDNPAPQQIEDAIRKLISERNDAAIQYRDSLRKVYALGDAIFALANAYTRITGRQPDIKDEIKPLEPAFSANTKLGDAIEIALNVLGKPLTKDELIRYLREGGARLSLKHPKIVVNTALKQDSKKRFVVLEDNRVWLAGKK